MPGREAPTVHDLQEIAALAVERINRASNG
jgi:hypothetical protein